MLCKSGACFSTVVCPPVFSDEVPVHGIANEELRQGPSFVDAFPRMHRFCTNLVEMALTDTDSSADEAATGSLREDPPQILVCVHNGMKFDFPFLCSECTSTSVAWPIGFSRIHWRCYGPWMQRRTAVAQSSNVFYGTAGPRPISTLTGRSTIVAL